MFYTDEVRNDWMSAVYIRNFLRSMTRLHLMPYDEYYDIDATLVGYNYNEYDGDFFTRWDWYDMVWGAEEHDSMYEETPRDRKRRKQKEKKDKLR